MEHGLKCPHCGSNDCGEEEPSDWQDYDIDNIKCDNCGYEGDVGLFLETEGVIENE